MDKNEYFVTENGLRVCYIQKNQFHKSYAGIGVNYGSRDLEFLFNQQKVQSKEGVAHFIEHKLFQMPDGDSFLKFAKMNANANAYTDLEKTIYYFSTGSDLFPPLQLLLEMFFTPYFTKEDVEKEKSIITSEIEMYEDIPQTQFLERVMKELFPKSSLSKSIAGTKKSVEETTVEDLETAFQAFYTTDNAFLVIVSHEPREKVIEFVEKIMKQQKVNRGIPQVISSLSIDKIGHHFTYQTHVEQTTAILGIQLKANHTMPMFCEAMIGLLDGVLAPSTAFYQSLYKQKAFTADIEYYVVTLKDTSYAIISTTTEAPELFLNTVYQKLKNLKKTDLDKKSIDLYLKHLKARSILSLDSIEELAEEVLILALEGGSYFKNLEDCQSLTREDFTPYLKFFNEGKYIQAICKKSTKS